MSWEVEKITPVGYDVQMDIRVHPWWGWIYKLVFKKDPSYIKSFYGSCTVWHNLKDGSRCLTITEGVLSNFYSTYRFDQEMEEMERKERKKVWNTSESNS